jgi:hypothetical protein
VFVWFKEGRKGGSRYQTLLLSIYDADNQTTAKTMINTGFRSRNAAVVVEALGGAGSAIVVLICCRNPVETLRAILGTS